MCRHFHSFCVIYSYIFYLILLNTFLWLKFNIKMLNMTWTNFECFFNTLFWFWKINDIFHHFHNDQIFYYFKFYLLIHSEHKNCQRKRRTHCQALIKPFLTHKIQLLSARKDAADDSFNCIYSVQDLLVLRHIVLFLNQPLLDQNVTVDLCMSFVGTFFPKIFYCLMFHLLHFYYKFQL